MTDKNNAKHTSDKSAQADEIFCSALEFENEDDRTAYIEEACADDGELLRNVTLLLSLQDRAETLFKAGNPANISASDIINTLTSIPEIFDGGISTLPDDDEVGKEIGNYKLLQKIGEGGVGNVYLAEQRRPVRRQVAFKIIKLGMDTKSVIARFEAERQALAMMDHPNIAHVLNAGETETGRPFFVMELVLGERITTYCDKNGLNIHKRLELFIQVCRAIQHAHQKGIIHRDIKPSNVLITLRDGVPSPIVIDFGIAKATSGELLTDKTLNTGIGPLIGTPAYMSPEQTNLTQVDIDTRSDIYSLGVLLYELLIGKTPFDQKELLKSGIDEMCRKVREDDPLQPSTKLQRMTLEDRIQTAVNRDMDSRKLCALLTGDLDRIVMKALEKHRERRYDTTSMLALDLERFLNNEPVAARPLSPFYRFQKMVRRNRVMFIYLGAVCIALLTGLGTSTWLFLMERKAHHRAVNAEQQETRLRIAAENREHIAQAALLIDSHGKIAEADSLVGAISELTPSLEAERVLRKLGEWHTLQGNWKKAADRFQLLLKVDTMDNSWAITDDLLMAGPVLLENGDVQGYEKFRQAAISRYKNTTDPVFAERTMKISLLLPANNMVMDQLKPLAEISTEATQGGVEDIMTAWRCISLALMAYRQDQASLSIKWCQKSRSFSENNPARIATSHVIQAMAHLRLEETAQAQRNLALGRGLIEGYVAHGLDTGDGRTGFWYDWLFARILQREAEILIESSPPSNSIR